MLNKNRIKIFFISFDATIIRIKRDEIKMWYNNLTANCIMNIKYFTIMQIYFSIFDTYFIYLYKP